MKRFSSFFCFLMPFFGLAQSNEFATPIAEIELVNLDLVSFDTKDNLFVSTTAGDIYQFDRSGKQINLFSPPRQGRLSQLEAAWTVTIFSFSADLQEYRILDRFLNPIYENGFLLSEVNLAKAATLGNNNIVWVWDESDLSLKSIDYLRNLVIQNQPLNLLIDTEDLEIIDIKEFKNRPFLSVKNEGILIFDNQGNLIRKIKLLIDQKLCFYNENLLWIEGGFLMSMSIKSQAIFKIAPIGNARSIQIGKDRLALIQEDTILLYELPPWLRMLR